MNKSDFSFLITSQPDRENVYLEVWLKKEMIAEITNENSNLKIIFYFENNIEFDYWMLLEILEEGKNKLLGN